MDKCKASGLLEAHCLKKTNQRIAVLDWILDVCHPFTANEVFLNINIDVNIDLATVYRVLALFTEKKILREVLSRAGLRYFELACVHNPEHPHFICTVCDAIDCLEKQDFGRLLEKYKKDFDITGVKINLSGICKKCREGKKSNNDRNREPLL